MDDHGCEELLVERGERSGLEMVIAIDSTRLGPALGGARVWSYPSLDDAIADAVRLAKGMTLKAAAAGLDLGGGKGVIRTGPEGPPTGELRRAALLDFGDAVESLGGRYITAEDVGTGPEEVAVIGERTSHACGLPGEMGGVGDPSPFTARGVEASIRTCCEHQLGSSDLADVRICIVGLGHVGTHLARQLAADGATVLVSDIDQRKRALARELGAEWVEPELAAVAGCEVLSPCALGGLVNEVMAPRLRCRIVCGAANNQLTDDSLADVLAEREILYAPDFIVNAGGLISVQSELSHAPDRDRAAAAVDALGDALGRVLDAARTSSTTPLAAARAIAEQRLAAAPDAGEAQPAAAAAPASPAAPVGPSSPADTPARAA